MMQKINTHEYGIDASNDSAAYREELLRQVQETTPHAWIDRGWVKFTTDDQGKELIRIDTQRAVKRL